MCTVQGQVWGWFRTRVEKVTDVVCAAGVDRGGVQDCSRGQGYASPAAGLPTHLPCH